MKIGIICPYNIFGGGGVQECVIALRDGLNKRGHEAYIISPKPIDFADHDTTGIILVGRARPVKAAQTSAQISVSVEIDEITSMLDREKFDILHFHEPWIPMLSMQIMSRSNAVHIATFHAAMSERRTSKTVEKIITPYTKSIFKYIDVMTAVSPTATNYVSSLTERPIEIIPNGIDLSKYKPSLNKENKIKTIFYVGRIEKRKGLKHLLEAFNLLTQDNPDYKLIIGGNGPDREKLEIQVRRDKIKNVEFLGYVPEKEKIKILREADIFCSPAIHGESFGIVLLEAMATGCVTVAGNNSGYSNVMEGLGQISLVNPKDPQEFARRIRFLTEQAEIRGLWKQWGYTYVRKYDYETVIDQYEELYKKSFNELKN